MRPSVGGTSARGKIKPKKVGLAVVAGIAAASMTTWALRTAGTSHGWPGAETPSVARQVLDAGVIANGKRVERRLVGRWVPQLVTHDDAAARLPDLAPSYILLTAQDLEARYGAVLIQSNRYNYGPPASYVLIVPRGYATGKQALAWCRREGLGSDRCVAKHLTHGPVKRSVMTS
jgi:hypothetical protein